MAKNNPKEWAVYTFCRTSKNSYIAAKVLFNEFKEGQASLLSFHQNGLPDEALRTAIDEFAARLSDYMWALAYKEAEGTRPKVRDSIKDETSDMQDLLDVIKENYK